jgi:hypothetical protein
MQLGLLIEPTRPMHKCTYRLNIAEMPLLEFQVLKNLHPQFCWNVLLEKTFFRVKDN